jgi:hypothetical protein
MRTPLFNKLLPSPIYGGFKQEGYFVWCGSVVKGEDGRYHMFASRWPESLGFRAQWLFNSQIVRASSSTPEGPYRFEEVVLPRRDRRYFDAMSQHNPQIKYWNGKYYLYYMGTTYGGPIPERGEGIREGRITEVWNNKRIGLAVSDSVFGPWKRRETPLLEPRRPGHWDCTVTTNPTTAIMSDGSTYMIYKSREYSGATLRLGVAHATSPEGPFVRLQDEPILQFGDPDMHVEDPFLWYTEDGTFHLLIKDDSKNGSPGLTGERGAGVYLTSKDCKNWDIGPNPKAYSRKVEWDNGSQTTQCNLERPFLLFHDGKPTHLFLATGSGSTPYRFEHTWNIVIPLMGETADNEKETALGKQRSY